MQDGTVYSSHGKVSVHDPVFQVLLKGHQALFSWLYYKVVTQGCGQQLTPLNETVPEVSTAVQKFPHPAHLNPNFSFK